VAACYGNPHGGSGWQSEWRSVMVVRKAGWCGSPPGGLGWQPSWRLTGILLCSGMSDNFVMFMNERGFYDVQELGIIL
jgi:hypothetical protein